jgi:hypothetical protein
MIEKRRSRVSDAPFADGTPPASTPAVARIPEATSEHGTAGPVIVRQNPARGLLAVSRAPAVIDRGS